MWRTFGCPGLLCEDAGAEVVSSLSPWSGGLQLPRGDGKDATEMDGTCRRIPMSVDEFVRYFSAAHGSILHLWLTLLPFARQSDGRD